MQSGQVAFGQDVETSELTDVDFLARVAWQPTVPPSLAQAARTGNLDKFWRAWSKALATRTDRKALKKRVASGGTLWPWSDARQHPAKELATILQKGDPTRLSRWAKQRLSDQLVWADERAALELLLLAEHLLNGATLEVSTALPVWRLVLTGACELNAQRELPAGGQLSSDRRLLLCGELPWTLGQLFAEVSGVTEFKQLGQQSLRNELIEMTDGDGTPAVDLLACLPRWIASLTRSVEIGAIFGEPLLEGEPQLRFEDVISKSVMLLDRDGGMLTSTDRESQGVTLRVPKTSGEKTGRVQATAALKPSVVGPVVAMLTHAASLVGLDELSLAGESLRFREHVARGGSLNSFRSETYAEVATERLIVTDTDLPAIQSDWANWACLRAWWSATSASAVLRHDEPNVWLQISPRGMPVMEGEWGLSVSLAGKPLKLDQGWKCTCWTSDTDMDYIELQHEWPDGPMLCRQMVLSRKDQFLVVADAVSRVGSRRIDLETRMPLCRGVRAKSDTATREVRLATSDVKVRCFPLALPDDRLHSTAGQFSADGTELRLTQASTGHALYAPIVFDWSPERAALEAEWRTLTVSEEGKRLAPWQAAGHRLRLGKLHLVVYRSLDDSDEFRAVLGLHTNQETVIAQFHEKGYVLPIVSVEA